MGTNPLIAKLEEDEARSRPYRADRLRYLLDQYGHDSVRIFPGGSLSLMAFEESRQAYLNGLFMACTIMCQVCLEHMLAGLFREAGRDDLDRATFKTLLREALDQGLLSADEFALFDRLRSLRNPYAHSRAPLGKGSMERRAVDVNIAIKDLVVHDAELAISSLLGLCQRAPFALATHQWGSESIGS